jgi:hypothetical protein
MFNLMWPLIGAAGGALFSKKDPLKGALLGAGLGSVPGLLNMGTAATYGTGLGSQQTAMLAAQDAGMGMFPTAENFMTKADVYMRPVSSGLSAANAAGLLGRQQQPIQPSPVIQNQGVGGNTLTQLYGQMQQSDMQRQQAELDRRMKQRELIARMGGYNGRIA